MSLLVRTSTPGQPLNLEALVGTAPSHTVILADVGAVNRLVLAAGETGEVVRLDNHITFVRAGEPMLYSWHETRALAPVRVRDGLVHVRPAYSAHSSVWDAACELTIVALTPGFLSRCAADLFKRDLARTQLRPSVAGYDPFLWSLGMRLDGLACLSDPQLAFMDELAAAMAMHLLLTAGAEPIARVARALSRGSVRRVSEFVDAHLGAQIRLADLAQLCGLSPFHFARQFKRETGTSPARYIRLRRMAEARRLLSETSLSIDHIAIAVGYHDASAFRRAFIGDHGLPPSRFRRSGAG